MGTYVGVDGSPSSIRNFQLMKKRDRTAALWRKPQPKFVKWLFSSRPVIYKFRYHLRDYECSAHNVRLDCSSNYTDRKGDLPLPPAQ